MNLSFHISTYSFISISRSLSIYIQISIYLYLDLYLSISMQISIYLYLAFYLSIYHCIQASSSHHSTVSEADSGIEFHSPSSISLSIYLYLASNLSICSSLSIQLSIFLSIFVSRHQVAIIRQFQKLTPEQNSIHPQVINKYSYPTKGRKHFLEIFNIQVDEIYSALGSRQVPIYQSDSYILIFLLFIPNPQMNLSQ